ncbi:MAG TPA: phospholipase D-like domain-containing protein [Solirubrobacterales bacterium]|nr:phospholipase D-like domain-containing protein [Solirubrobacterales bacterium]
MSAKFVLSGSNKEAPFDLKVRRGEGMVLLSMDWKEGEPPDNFVGFAIECKAPDDKEFFALENRLSFAATDGSVAKTSKSTRLSPLQKFRWVHFPRDAEVDGEFTYRVTPVSMDDGDALTYGEPQEVDIVLGGETYPGKLNVTFTRGFVSSQAFVDRFEKDGEKISTLIPSKADAGLDFEPSHPDAPEALNWMGFEARRAILALLDEAIADKDAQVRVVAYDMNTPEIVTRLEQLGDRLKVIIDDSDAHGEKDSAETAAAKLLAKSAGADNVKRQHMGNLQHNKSIVVDGPKVKAAVGGSTNMSWRGLYVQSNNAVILRGEGPVKKFSAAFDSYWENSGPADFGATEPAQMTTLGLDGIDAQVAFSPHTADNALLETIGADIDAAESSLLYSLAFLSQTKGPIKEAIKKATENPEIFVYGIADRKVGGLDLQTPAGNVAPVFSSRLSENVPEPFRSEPSGGSGIRMHHKFVVIDFDKPTARVYLGSYNFSDPADTKNGENLLLIKDPGVAAAYTVEALRIFDHYRFRVAEQEAEDADDTLSLAKPPKSGEKPWWDKYYTDPQKRRDREVFA